MSDLFAHFPVAMWTIDAILWLLGIFFWGATYIGAPLESKKSGKHVSGFPGLAFLFFLGAGYMSQYKLLMLVALTDISVVYHGSLFGSTYLCSLLGSIFVRKAVFCPTKSIWL